MLQKTGERQVGATLDEIREDHKERYLWARERLDGSQSVLDAGCGVGYGSVLLSERASKVHAIDVSSDAVTFAKRYWHRENISHDVQDLHFFGLPHGVKYDAIVAFEIIEHLIEPRLFLRRVRRALSKDGRLWLSVPNERQIPHTVELNPFHMRHYTAEEISDLLVDCGYQVAAIHSQDTKEITARPDGRFLIVEARVKSGIKVDVKDEDLSETAVMNAAALIVARATALSKARKDTQTLKTRLEEATKTAAAAERGAQTPSPEVLSSLNAIDQRMQALETAVASDLRQKTHLLETSERAARQELVTAHFSIARLEDERRSLAGEIKRADERRAELMHDVSRLNAETSSLRHTLTVAGADAARLAYAQDRLADQKAEVESTRRALDCTRAEIETVRQELSATRTSNAAALAETRLGLENALNERDRMAAQLHAAEAERTALLSALAVSKGAVNEAIARCHSVELERARLTEEHAKAGLDLQRLQQELNQVQAAEAERTTLLSALAVSKGTADDAVARCHSAESECARLTEELAEAGLDLQGLQQERDQILNEVQAAEAERTTLLSALAASKGATDEAIARCRSAESERTQLVEELAHATAAAADVARKQEIAEAQRVAQAKAGKKHLTEVEAALKQAQNDLAAKVKEANAANGKSKQLSLRMLGMAAESDALRKANETLVVEMDRARATQMAVSTSGILPKEPPSVGYMWRKLKHHQFYGPFLGRAIRNSIGLRRPRKHTVR